MQNGKASEKGGKSCHLKKRFFKWVKVATLKKVEPVTLCQRLVAGGESDVLRIFCRQVLSM